MKKLTYDQRRRFMAVMQNPELMMDLSNEESALFLRLYLEGQNQTPS